MILENFMVDFVFITWDVYGASKNRHPNHFFETQKKILRFREFEIWLNFFSFSPKRGFSVVYEQQKKNWKSKLIKV